MSTYNGPTYDQLMQPTLDALHALGGVATNQQIYEWVIERLNLPQETLSQRHKPDSSLTEVEYRMMWARTYLSKVGLIDKPARSTWRLTDEGRETIHLDSRSIVRAVKQKSKLGNPEASAVNEAVVDELDEIQTGANDVQNDTDSTPISLTPLFPQYGEARHFLQILDNTPYSEYRDMINAIREQIGSPQEQVDWTRPDEWIPARLTGKVADLASRLWSASQHQINPRHTRGAWYFVIRHQLLQRDTKDLLQVTPRGKDFIDHPLGSLEAQIDQDEGVLLILRLVAEKGPARRRDLISEFTEYCHSYTTIQSQAAIKGFLYNRLRNLTERQFITSSGQHYEVTASGIAYLKQFADYIPGTREQNEQQADIHALAKQLRDNARRELHAHLLEMNPYKFESLVKLLLEEIGYTNVAVTSATNDKGVDVIANIELGISSVREVVQVKRLKGSVNRVVLDQLRGSLYRFDAVRGTIITTGSFTKGAQEAAFERGAPPITLIDGEKMLELLIENGIGIKKTPVQYYEFTPETLAQFGSDDEDGV